MAAVINANTGSIRLPGFRQRIKRGMTLDAFLAGSLAPRARSDGRRGRSRRYHFGTVEFEGEPFRVSVFFADGVIASVDLCYVGERYGKSWEDWSEKKERARKAFHDRWLRRQLGPQPLSTDFPWGEVVSCYDARSGGSSITIRYRRGK